MMQGFFTTIQVFLVCVTALTLGGFAAMAFPQSKVAEFLLPIVTRIAADRKEKREEQNS
jgi:hypothetical protein